MCSYTLMLNAVTRTNREVILQLLPVVLAVMLSFLYVADSAKIANTLGCIIDRVEEGLETEVPSKYTIRVSPRF